jgi:hypothetical protein
MKTVVWRKRLGVEPSLPAKRRATGFEDREGHRAPFTSIIKRTSATQGPPKWGDSMGRAVAMSSACTGWRWVKVPYANFG